MQNNMKALVLGYKGMLGRELFEQLQKKNFETVGLDRDALDITDFSAAAEKISELRPDFIFNCIAYNFVDKAEDEPDQAMKINYEAVANLAKTAQKIGAVLVHYSTGYVFDGAKSSGYDEDNLPNPLSVYGKSKLFGEKAAAEFCHKAYIIRLNQLFGEPGLSMNSKKSFVDIILDLALNQNKKEFDFVSDEISTRVYAVDLAAASVELALKNFPYGIYHLTNEGQASWYDWAEEIFKLRNIDVKLNKVSSSGFVRKALRPANSSLNNNKFSKLRTWQKALENYLEIKI